MKKELLAEKVILLEGATSKTSVTLWIGYPYQQTNNGVTVWTCDWGATGILDDPRTLVGDTAFDALVRNLADMRSLLKESLQGRKIIDSHLAEYHRLHPDVVPSPYVTLKALFGDV